MKTISLPRGLAPHTPTGYRGLRWRTYEEPTTGERHFTTAQGPLPPAILEVPREGSGAATNGHLGCRSLRRGYSQARGASGVRQEGTSSLIHLKDIEALKHFGRSLRVTKGRVAMAQKPTVDSIYLAQRINERWNSHSLSPAGLQTLVNKYGDRAVEDALRELHGFPPEIIRSPYAYLEEVIRARSPQGSLGEHVRLDLGQDPAVDRAPISLRAGS